jgi:hypothetical protein
MSEISTTTPGSLGVRIAKSDMLLMVLAILSAIGAMATIGSNVDLGAGLATVAFTLGSAAAVGPVEPSKRPEVEPSEKKVAAVTSLIGGWLPVESVTLSPDDATEHKNEILLPRGQDLETLLGGFIDALMWVDPDISQRGNPFARREVVHTVLAALLFVSDPMDFDDAIRMELPAGVPFTTAETLAVVLMDETEELIEVNVGLGFGEPFWTVTFLPWGEDDWTVTATEALPFLA